MSRDSIRLPFVSIKEKKGLKASDYHTWKDKNLSPPKSIPDLNESS